MTFTSETEQYKEMVKKVQSGAYDNSTPYNNDKTERERRRQWRAVYKHLTELFMCDAIRACGLKDHRNGRKAAEYAWEERHSEGYLAVLDTLADLADLMVG